MPKKLERDAEYDALRALHQVLGSMSTMEQGEIREQHLAVLVQIEAYFNLYFDNSDKMFTVPQLRAITERLDIIKARVAVGLYREGSMVDDVLRADHARFPDAPADLLELLERNLQAAETHRLTEVMPRFALAAEAWADLRG